MLVILLKPQDLNLVRVDLKDYNLESVLLPNLFPFRYRVARLALARLQEPALQFMLANARGNERGNDSFGIDQEERAPAVQANSRVNRGKKLLPPALQK